MTSTRYSPGPWRSSYRSPVTAIEDVNGEELARVWYATGHDGKYTHRLPGFENSVLMAAAPELLDALEGLLVCRCGTPGGPEVHFGEECSHHRTARELVDRVLLLDYRGPR